MAKPGAVTSRHNTDHAIQDRQGPCPNYTLPLNPCDRNCCRHAPSPLMCSVTQIPWCSTAPSTHELWGCGMPYLLVSPWPHPLMLSSIGCARCATVLARPTTHPLWHPPCWGNFPVWVDGWVRGEVGVPRGRVARPPLARFPLPPPYPLTN